METCFAGSECYRGIGQIEKLVLHIRGNRRLNVVGSTKLEEGGTFSRWGHIKLKPSANVGNYATVKWNHICFFHSSISKEYYLLYLKSL